MKHHFRYIKLIIKARILQRQYITTWPIGTGFCVCLFWGFSFHLRTFQSYGDVTAAHSDPLTVIKQWGVFHTYRDTGHSFMIFISEDPCLFYTLKKSTSFSSMLLICCCALSFCLLRHFSLKSAKCLRDILIVFGFTQYRQYFSNVTAGLQKFSPSCLLLNKNNFAWDFHFKRLFIKRLFLKKEISFFCYTHIYFYGPHMHGGFTKWK